MTVTPEGRRSLPAGAKRRMSDARCAWKKMTPEQRAEFAAWMKDNESLYPVAGGRQ